MVNPDLLNGLMEFREHLGGELTVTLLNGIGEGFEAHVVHEDLVRKSIAQLHSRFVSRHARPV
jgi:3-dehydroquinate synthase